MKKNIFVFVLALCVSTGFSQVYFAIDNIFLDPENPNTQDSVGIILSGDLTSTGSYIDTAFFEIIDNEIFITIDCNSTGGYQMLIDHEKTINLGLLPSGD
ncbi:MAG: hypothetical protein GQ527_09690, partial [Bacteroidales bacterium]|nr:hypothetical protein [Bacteroidales bacterium]